MPTSDEPETGSLDRARRVLRRAQHAVALPGAGVSAASGVPTFRGEDGLWRDYRPEELATPGAFSDDPVTVWQWYGWRRRTVAGCEPNRAHGALARWTLENDGARLVTQNVDDLHGRALRAAAGGRPIPEHARAVELHGSLFRTLCTGCGRRRESREEIDPSGPGDLPRCGECGELLRPDVVWFGESLPREALDAAMEAARRADACLVAGRGLRGRRHRRRAGRGEPRADAPHRTRRPRVPRRRRGRAAGPPPERLTWARSPTS